MSSWDNKPQHGKSTSFCSLYTVQNIWPSPLVHHKQHPFCGCGKEGGVYCLVYLWMLNVLQIMVTLKFVFHHINIISCSDHRYMCWLGHLGGGDGVGVRGKTAKAQNHCSLSQQNQVISAADFPAVFVKTKPDLSKNMYNCWAFPAMLMVTKLTRHRNIFQSY